MTFQITNIYFVGTWVEYNIYLHTFVCMHACISTFILHVCELVCIICLPLISVNRNFIQISKGRYGRHDAFCIVDQLFVLSMNIYHLWIVMQIFGHFYFLFIWKIPGTSFENLWGWWGIFFIFSDIAAVFLRLFAIWDRDAV